MTTIPQPHPMPAFDCPSWCTADHEADWDLHMSVAYDTRPIPAAGGGYLPDTRMPAEQWATLDYFDVLHVADAVRLAVGDRGEVEVQQQQLPDGSAPSIYLNGEGTLTSQQARELAALLLEAADRLERSL